MQVNAHEGAINNYDTYDNRKYSPLPSKFRRDCGSNGRSTDRPLSSDPATSNSTDSVRSDIKHCIQYLVIIEKQLTFTSSIFTDPNFSDHLGYTSQRWFYRHV